MVICSLHNNNTTCDCVSLFYYIVNYIIIIIIIISYFNWVAISLRLLLRAPGIHTHNQIKSIHCLVAAVGHLLSCSQVGGRGCR